MKHMATKLRYGLAIVVWALATLQPASAESWTPLPTITHGKGDQCVEDTQVMRKRHFEFILHQRDETMHRGIRTEKHSLNKCIECHAKKGDDGEYLPVTAPGQFCQSCHAYAAVHIDCFECHATRPEKK